jgi:polyisoprenoid-binding protein YceI
VGNPINPLGEKPPQGAEPKIGQAYVARWAIDPVHSEILFAIRYLMISTIRGRFDHFSGYIGFAQGQPLPAVVEVEIDAASIDTGNAERDTHLRSPDFFDVATYPTIYFVSRQIEPVSATQFQITGDLRLHGVSREVILEATFEGSGHDPWGNTRAGFTAITQINRRDFGISWNQPLETGVVLGDTVKITLDIQAVKQG